MKLEDLKAPFKEDEYEWRVQSSGVYNENPWASVLCYVTNRAIMDRLDDVCGPENWQNTLTPIDKGMICGISIKVPRIITQDADGSGEWVTKYDGSQNTDIEATKGGISKSMVRAAVQWGIGRLLYKLDAAFANTSKTKVNGWNKAGKGKDAFYWQTPTLPSWAVDGEVKKSAPPAKPKPKPPKTLFWNALQKSGLKCEKPIKDDILLEYIEDIINELGEAEGVKVNKDDENDTGYPLITRQLECYDLTESITIFKQKRFAEKNGMGKKK